MISFRFILPALIPVLILASMERAWSDTDEERFGRVFSSVMEKLDDVLVLKDRHNELPDEVLIGPDKVSNENKIDRLLDDAIGLLTDSRLMDVRNQMAGFQNLIGNSQQKIARYRELRISAPDDTRLNFFERWYTTSRQDYDDMITREEGAIIEHEAAIVSTKASFEQELSRLGIQIDRSEVDALLSSVIADDFAGLAAVFENLKRIMAQLQTLTEESGESLEVTRKYYGLYVLLVQALDHAQDEFVETIRYDYRPRLQRLHIEAQDAIRNAEHLLKTGEGHEAVLRANIEANQTTLQAIDLYDAYLKMQADMITRENRRVERQLATAENTYATVRVSTQVVEFLRESRDELDALMNLEMPSIQLFENQELKNEIQRLTQQLAT